MVLPRTSINLWTMTTARPVGELLRDWRQRRRMSQLALAVEANVSTRHLSFVESGRSAPSREMILHLSEYLDIPLRERNRLLLAAGFAPGYEERALGDPELRAAQQAMSAVLDGHDPYPAIAIDRRWTLVAANRAVAPLLADCAPELLTGTINVLRLSLHPNGLAPRIDNYAQWRSHLLQRVARGIELSADPELIALHEELLGYPAPPQATSSIVRPEPMHEIVIPMRLRSPLGLLSFISTTTVFGSPLEVSLSELAIEAFYPADAATAEALRRAQPTT
jgi:transcriptional regulator with XRE-family HTH domain